MLKGKKVTEAFLILTFLSIMGNEKREKSPCGVFLLK